MSRSCAIPSCSVRPKTGHLMCREHWFLVPMAARQEVTEGWAALRRCQKAMDMPGRSDRYRAAIGAAVASVEAMYAEAAS